MFAQDGRTFDLAYLLERTRSRHHHLTALNCLQGARYVELARNRAANEAFLFGWLRTRVGLAA